MAELIVKMFGPPSVSVDGRPVTFSYRKADALLYYMILRKRAPRSELAGLLWADSDSSAALKNLRHAVYTIRKGLGFDVFLSGASGVLELEAEASIRCDAAEFLEGGNPELVKGDFLEGFSLPNCSLFDEWLTGQRNLMHTQSLRQLLAAEKAAFRRGDLAQAEQLGLRYVQQDPLEEQAAVILMELYSAQKKFRKAIAVYHRLYQSLSDELSIAPLKETTALYYRIVNEWNASTYKMEEQSHHLLAGKDLALRRLLLLCNGPAADRRAPCALVTGEAGVGKTYLLDHILSCYDFSGWLVCRAFCHQSELGDPLAPWNAVMMSLMSETEAHRISVPESYLKTAAGLFPCLSAGIGQEYVFSDLEYPLQRNYNVAQESALLVFSYVARQVPLLLIFEDIHWMDPNSAAMLATLLRRLRNLNLIVICTCRDTCPPHIQQLIDSARQDGILENCPIERFTREETARFVQHYLSSQTDPGLLDRIYESTGGNALLLVQLLTSMQELSDPSTITDNLDNIIGSRLKSLPQEERQVLDLISVFPGWVPFQTLAAILTRDTMELMYLCNRLKQRMLIAESGQDGTLSYSLAHDQIRTVLREQQSEAALRILHLRVAQYLESQPAFAPIQLYETLTYHYSEGGDRYKAFQYRVLYLNACVRLYYSVLPTLTEDSSAAGPQDIAGHFRTLEQELAVLRSVPAQDWDLDRLEAILLHAKSCYCIYVGYYPEGLEALDRLVQLCTASGNRELLLRAHLQYIYYGIQIWDPPVMQAHIQAGMELLAGRERSEEFGIYLRMEGLLQLMRSQYQLARATLQRSIDTLRALDPSDDGRYAINIAGAYNYIAESYRLEGNYDRAFLTYDQAIIYNRSRGYYPGAAVFYTNYGVAAFQKGETAAARQLFDFALETYRAAHEYSGRPIALSYLALFEVQDGSYEQAAAYLREAFQVSEQIGSPWWKGITLYQCWHIRLLLSSRGGAPEVFRGLWPQSPRAHCLACLDCLRRLQPGVELREMEQALSRLEREER